MVSPKTFGAHWSKSAYTIRECCKLGMIDGAKKVVHSWRIPENASISAPKIDESAAAANDANWFITQREAG